MWSSGVGHDDRMVVGWLGLRSEVDIMISFYSFVRQGKVAYYCIPQSSWKSEQAEWPLPMTLPPRHYSQWHYLRENISYDMTSWTIFPMTLPPGYYSLWHNLHDIIPHDDTSRTLFPIAIPPGYYSLWHNLPDIIHHDTTSCSWWHYLQESNPPFYHFHVQYVNMLNHGN